ncbi:MAG: glycosyltransferase family 4 protein [Acidimicrobiia bacterium]|nr:glycosyltransferase family 4 protein [Acidimicrobiia bacterium]
MERIAIDVTAAITGRTGIARYVLALADAIEALPEAPTVARFAVGRALVEVPERTRHFPVPLRVVDRAWRAVAHPRVERITGLVDSVHASGPNLVPARAPVVAVVYDLAALDHPALHPARDVRQLRRYVEHLARADAVMAISATTADRLVASGVAPGRVHVAPIGRSPFPTAVDPPLAGRRYVLAVGAPVPRKGFDVLLRALARVDDPDLGLALIGPPGPEDDALAELAAALQLTDRVHRAGPVTEAELAGWYQHALVLAAPSVDEGFGLPLVEALALGTPVVATDIAVFREVTGRHALLVPLGDVDALAAALAEAADRPPSVVAQVALGTAHVAQYTWAACAAATVAVHRAL